jgi:hypothetical protein
MRSRGLLAKADGRGLRAVFIGRRVCFAPRLFEGHQNAVRARQNGAERFIASAIRNA